jgi:hypothetical protein
MVTRFENLGASCCVLCASVVGVCRVKNAELVPPEIYTKHLALFMIGEFQARFFASNQVK